MTIRNQWLPVRVLSLSVLVLSLSSHFGQINASQNVRLRQEVRSHQPEIISPKFSLSILPKNLAPLSINNHSDILVRDQKQDSLAIFSHGKLFPIRPKSPGLCAMNDQCDILMDDYTGSQPIVQIKGKSYSLRLPAGYFVSPCINDNGEILIQYGHRGIGGFGFYKNGKVTLLCRGAFDIAVNSMNEKHQVVGQDFGSVVPAPRGRKPIFTARPVLWEKGKFQYLKWPGTGFCAPMGINNNGQIVGEYRPEHGNPHRYAVLWMGPSAPMLEMDSFAAPSKSWHLSANAGCNDKLQITGYGAKNGKICSYLCSVSLGNGIVKKPM